MRYTIIQQAPLFQQHCIWIRCMSLWYSTSLIYGNIFCFWGWTTLMAKLKWHLENVYFSRLKYMTSRLALFNSRMLFHFSCLFWIFMSQPIHFYKELVLGTLHIPVKRIMVRFRTTIFSADLDNSRENNIT